MKTQFKIPFTVNQAKKIVSKDDYRPALRGVFFNAELKEFCLTDGHKLVRVGIIEDKELLPKTSFVIPLDALPKTKKDVSLTFYEYIEEEQKIKADNVGSSAFFNVIDYTYPDYLNVIPKNAEEEVSTIGLNPQLFEDTNVFLKAFNLDNNGLKLEFNGQNRAVIFEPLKPCSYNISGLIMPMMLNNY